MSACGPYRVMGVIRETKSENKNNSLVSVFLGELRGAGTENNLGHIWGREKVSMVT